MIDHSFMKRMAPFLVLEILKKYTDEEHGLKVSQIVALMEQDYNITIDRKSVGRILNDLLELSEIPQEYDWKNPMHFSIKFDVTKRSTGDIHDNWRLCKEFEDTEVRLLIDLLMSLQGYPYRRLLEKLQRLGGLSLQNRNNVRKNENTVNYQMPVNIACMERAIRDRKKVSFDYRASEDDRHGLFYTVSPYTMTFRNGSYYLICYDEAKEDMTIFRADKIKNALILEESVIDFRMVSSMARWNFDINMYLDHCIPICNDLGGI